MPVILERDWIIADYLISNSGWIGAIIAYFDERTTSGVVEGINNKLKLIKRRAYGMRNFTNFKLRSFLTWHFTIWFYILSSVEPKKLI